MGSECRTSSGARRRDDYRRRIFIHDVRGCGGLPRCRDSALRVERCVGSGVRPASTSGVGWPSATGEILARSAVVSAGTARSPMCPSFSKRSANLTGGSSLGERRPCRLSQKCSRSRGSGAAAWRYLQRHSGRRALAGRVVTASLGGLARGRSNSSRTPWRPLTRG